MTWACGWRTWWNLYRLLRPTPVVGWISKIPTLPILRMDGQNAAKRTVTHTSTKSTLSRNVGSINPTQSLARTVCTQPWTKPRHTASFIQRPARTNADRCIISPPNQKKVRKRRKAPKRGQNESKWTNKVFNWDVDTNPTTRNSSNWSQVRLLRR